MTHALSVRYNLPNNRISCVRSHQEWLRENGPKTPGNPPATLRGRVQTPVELWFREMRGMDRPRGRRVSQFATSLPPSPFPRRGHCVTPPVFPSSESVHEERLPASRRRQRAVAAENPASSIAGGHAPQSSVSNRRSLIARPSRVRRVKRRYPLRDYQTLPSARSPRVCCGR